MGKPEVRLSASPTLIVGERSPIEIEIVTTDETKIEYIDARIRGDQGWRIGSGKSQVTQRIHFPELTTRLMGEGVLPASTTTRFSTSFVLPQSTAPTHEMSPAWSRLRLRVHISIPWRIDGRHNYEFDVRVPAPLHVVRTPQVHRSTASTAPHDAPRIELALASTRLIAGEMLVGTCAVFHMDDAKPREVELALVPMFDLIAGSRIRERRGDAIVSTLTLPAGSAGQGVRFELPLPAAMTPSFTTITHRLSWWLTARSGSFFGTKVDVSVPLEILDASAAARTAKLTAAPRVGDERVAALFAQVAARRGWTGGTPSADDEATFSIERTIGDVVARIAYVYRNEQGTYLVSSIEHPSIGLGLSITRSSTMRHVFFRDIEVDIAPWDRAHLVAARSAEQTVPMLKQLVPTLMLVESLGPLIRATDDELVFERPHSNIDEGTLGGLATVLEQLAPAVAAAHARIGPPPGLSVDVDAWRALARGWSGTLALGDLSIQGTVHGLPVDCSLEFDAEGRARSVGVAVGDPQLASEHLRAIAIDLPRPAADVLGSAAAAPLVERMIMWPADLVNLRVRDGVARASYVLPEPRTVDATRVRELAEALRAVLTTLEPGAGPYR